MFNHVVTNLISGNFICQVVDPAAYDFLADKDFHNGKTHAEDVDQYLRRIGMKLAVTSSGGAYYCTHLGAEEGRKAAKTLFLAIAGNMRMLVDFMKLVMDATGKDYSINPGEKVDVNRLMGHISQNPSLLEALRKVANLGKTVASDGTDRQRLDKLMKKMCQDGYLHECNREQDIYQFTGKVEFISESIDFFTANDKINLDDEAFDSKVAE